MRSLATALVLGLALTQPAGAQSHPQTREGFWISFGFGWGSISCEGCVDRAGGGLGYLRMGGTLSQRLLIGGEANAWSKRVGSTTWTIGNVGPVLYFYPNADGGFFLKGGLGLATAEIESGPWSGSIEGAGITLGFGWDARVARGFALTPYVDLLLSNFDTGSLNTIGFGLGFTWP
jgi:hypothetical protein